MFDVTTAEKISALKKTQRELKRRGIWRKVVRGDIKRKTSKILHINGLTLTRTDFKAGGQNPVARLFVRHLERGSEEKSRGGEELNIAETPPKVVAQQ